MTRRARFKVAARCDGTPSCTITVEVCTHRGPIFGDEPIRALISVRPKGRRRVYSLPLATVAEMIVARVVKAEVRPLLAPRKRRRG